MEIVLYPETAETSLFLCEIGLSRSALRKALAITLAYLLALTTSIYAAEFYKAPSLSKIVYAIGLPLMTTPLDARVFGHGGVSAAGNARCPFGNIPNDGCTQQIASGLEGVSTWSNCLTDVLCAKGTSQNYLSRIQENQPGMEYGVGVPITMAATAKDPAVGGNLTGTGCTYNALAALWGTMVGATISGTNVTFTPNNSGTNPQPGQLLSASGIAANTTVVSVTDSTHLVVNNSGAWTGSKQISLLGGPKITCSGPVVLNNFQFGAVGGHLAPVLNLVGATSIDVENNFFTNDANTHNAANNNDTMNLGAGVGSSANFIFLRNTVDGQCPAQHCAIGDYNWTVYTAGTKLFQYNYFVNMPLRITAGCGSASLPCAGPGGSGTEGWTHFYNNFFHGLTNSLSTNHGEVIEDIASQFSTTVIDTIDYMGNWIVVPAGADATVGNTAVIYASGGAAPVFPTYTHFWVRDSTLITNATSGVLTTSALVDYQNGMFNDIELTNLAVDMSGTGGHNFRFNCNSALFNTSTLNGTTGDIVVTSWIASWGKILANMFLGIGPTTYTSYQIIAQTVGSSGGNGTYSSTYRGSNQTTTVIGNGGQGNSALSGPGVVTMTNIQDMLQNQGTALITSFNYKSLCAGPPIPTPP